MQNHRRGVFAAFIVLLLGMTLVPASAAEAGTPFFGHSKPHVGDVFHDLHLKPNIVARRLEVTERSHGVIKGKATIRTAHGVMNTDFEWHGNCNWVFNVHPHQHVHHSTSVAAGNIHGQIAMEHCQKHLRLSLHDYEIGDAVVNVRLHAVPGHGFEGTTYVGNLKVGDVQFTHAQVGVSTLDPTAHVTGDMVTNKGTFHVTAQVKGKPSDYQIHVRATGADMEIEGRGFHFKEFTFETNFHKNSHDHYVASGDVSGTVKMKHTTYRMRQGHIKIVGDKLKELSFNLEVTHESGGGVTYTGILHLALDIDGGHFSEMSYGSGGNGPHLVSHDTHYRKALVGQMTVAKTRGFSKKYGGRRFRREVTIGLTFGVAIYTEDNSHYKSYIGAGGFFDANRVSGSFGCTYARHASDFSCLGTLRLNPRWSGIHRVRWAV